MGLVTFFMTFSTLFIVGAFLGWLIELFYRRYVPNRKTKKWVNPGFLSGPWLPLYGFGLSGLYFIRYGLDIVLTDRLDPVWATVITLVAMSVAMTVIEYIAGIIFIKGMGIKLWDYSNEWGNIQGIICPLYSLFWTLVAVFYFFVVHPRIHYLIDFVLTYREFLFCVGFFYGIFAVDLWNSLDISVKMRKFAKENKMVLSWEQLKISVSDYAKSIKERSHFVRFFKSIGNLKETLQRYQREFEEKNLNRKGKHAIKEHQNTQTDNQNTQEK